MTREYIQYVHQHPPRCIIELMSVPTKHSKPTFRLPPDLSVYHSGYGEEGEESDTASFIIGCSCGHRAVNLLGYYVSSETSRGSVGFVGPLSLECEKCGKLSTFFDSRKHGYDGEQGVNTYIIGEGKSDKFACPRCGPTLLIVCANFTYHGAEDSSELMQKNRTQDFFRGFDVAGQCLKCNGLIEITSFECA
jgi:hypothetical protein